MKLTKPGELRSFAAQCSADTSREAIAVRVFVVGPSGVGKSTLLSRLAPRMRFEVCDLDALDNQSGLVEWAPGWEVRRWARDVERLARLSDLAPSRDIVVDVGAGSLQTAEGRAYFRSQSDNTVAVVAPWPLVFARRQPRPYTREVFQATEYSADRLAAYAAARFSVDASGTPEEAASELERHLNAILAGRGLDEGAAEQ